MRKLLSLLVIFLLLFTYALPAYAVDLDDGSEGSTEAVENAADETPPSISVNPSGQEFSDSLLIEISSDEENTTIYYTLDGSVPTSESLIYDEAFTIDETATLKTFGVDGENNTSAVITEDYTLKVPPAAPEESEVDETSPVVSAAPVSQSFTESLTVELLSNRENTSIYYTLDGEEPTTDSTLYNEPFIIEASTTVKAFGVDNADNTSAVITEDYTLEVPPAEPEETEESEIDKMAPIVSVNPVSQSFTESLTIELLSNEENTSIYYTLDGKDPTVDSTLYVEPFIIEDSATMKAFGVDSSDNTSVIITENYTLEVPPTEPALDTVAVNNIEPILTTAPLTTFEIEGPYNYNTLYFQDGSKNIYEYYIDTQETVLFIDYDIPYFDIASQNGVLYGVRGKITDDGSYSQIMNITDGNTLAFNIQAENVFTLAENNGWFYYNAEDKLYATDLTNEYLIKSDLPTVGPRSDCTAFNGSIYYISRDNHLIEVKVDDNTYTNHGNLNVSAIDGLTIGKNHLQVSYNFPISEIDFITDSFVLDTNNPYTHTMNINGMAKGNFDAGQRVRFNPNNGESEWDVIVPTGSPIDPPDPEPTKEGYRLLYWGIVNEVQDAGKSDTLEALEPYDFDADVVEDLYLEAVWEKVVTQYEYDTYSMADTDSSSDPYAFGLEHSYSDKNLVLFAQLRDQESAVTGGDVNTPPDIYNLRNDITDGASKSEIISDSYTTLSDTFEVLMEDSDEGPASTVYAFNYFASDKGILYDATDHPIGYLSTEVIDYNDGSGEGKWHTIAFEGSYADPVVIAQFASHTGPNYSHLRLRNITDESVDVFIEEWDEHSHTKHHNHELISIMVIASGVHTLNDGTVIEATKTTGEMNYKYYPFFENYDHPVVFSQSQDYYNPKQVWMGQKYIDNSSVYLKMLRENNTDASVDTAGSSATANETIGYIVIGELSEETITVDITPDSGLFNPDIDVTMTTNSPSNTIYYTLDGSDPTPSSSTYDDPITITQDTTVKAIAKDIYSNSSDMAEETYELCDLSGTLSVDSELIYEGDDVTATLALYNGEDPVTGQTVKIYDNGSGKNATEGDPGEYTVTFTPTVGMHEITAKVSGFTGVDFGTAEVQVINIIETLEHGRSFTGTTSLDSDNTPYNDLALFAQLTRFNEPELGMLRSNIIERELVGAMNGEPIVNYREDNFYSGVENSYYVPALAQVENLDYPLNYLASETGVIKNTSGKIIGVVGHELIPTYNGETADNGESYHEVEYHENIDNPVVLAHLGSDNEISDIHARVMYVAPEYNGPIKGANGTTTYLTQFGVKLEKNIDYSSNPSEVDERPEPSNFEVISYLVIEEGVHQVGDVIIEAEKITEDFTDAPITHEFSDHYYMPSVFSQTQTGINPSRRWMRENNITSNTVDLMVQEVDTSPVDYTADDLSSVIYTNYNISGVNSNPSNPTTFTIDTPHYITSIQTYHYFNRGTLPGTLALESDDETTYGPWQATGSQGQGYVDNAYWNVSPNITIPAGTYTVLDSNNSTWSHNRGSNYSGMTKIEGYPSQTEANQPEEVAVVLVADNLLHEVTFTNTYASTFDPQMVEHGTTATNPGTPSRSGYNFTGWTFEGSSFNIATDVVLEDIELVATWSSTGGGGTTTTATISAEDDTLVTDEDTPVSVSTAELMANDTDADDFESVQNPINGSVSLSGGTVTFTPDPGFFGTGYFSYTISDGGDEDNGLVTVTVNELVEINTFGPPLGGDPNALILINDEEPPLGAIDYSLPYVIGYPDESFKPNREITRGEMAAIFARILFLDTSNPGDPIYSDVKPDDWYYKYVQTVSRMGIFGGYEGNEFKPNRPITHAEIAAAFSEYWDIKGIEISDAGGTYSDVEGHWAEDEINRFFNAGISVGFMDGTFKPNAFTTRAELVVMVNRTLNRPELVDVEPSFPDVQPNFWGFGAIEAASKRHQGESAFKE